MAVIQSQLLWGVWGKLCDSLDIHLPDILHVRLRDPYILQMRLSEGLFVIYLLTDRQPESLLHTHKSTLPGQQNFLQGTLLGIWKPIKVEGSSSIFAVHTQNINLLSKVHQSYLQNFNFYFSLPPLLESWPKLSSSIPYCLSLLSN